MFSLYCLASSRTIKRWVFLTWKVVANLFSSEGRVTRVFIYETNVFEGKGKITCTTNTLYSGRSYLLCCKPSVALSEKYLIEVRILGWKYKNNETWRLALIEYNINNPEQAETIVRIRKKETVVSAFSCLQQFSLGSFLERYLHHNKWHCGSNWIRIYQPLLHPGFKNAWQSTRIATTTYQDEFSYYLSTILRSRFQLDD